ncbi:MAG: Asp23/Gls24 family envelope stress response protein [Firmicutes bacterium]|nr:Asp23/Gls24 family envelope stress response protein [Bacillota bacterium]MCL2255687.1 Asp23/Gls24 family envelope stress response protein [Bacillota bacterium]
MPLKSRYNANFTGDVTYGNKVVEGIIELAVKEINGISSLSGKGVKCEIVGEKVNVEVFVNVLNTVSCPDVAFRVQENVKKTLESMTSYKAGSIDVNVCDLAICGLENA